MRYFKVKIGYGEEEYVSIDETYLDAVVYAFMTESKVILPSGVVRGKDIINILEDWHKEMGWNRGYRIGEEDYAEIARCGVRNKYFGALAASKERVSHHIETRQEHLIGKNHPEPQRIEATSAASKVLAEKFRLK